MALSDELTAGFNMLHNEGSGAFFKTALSGDTLQFVGYSFFDDTDLCSFSNEADSTDAPVSADMQHTMNLWEGGVRATGGALVPEKSFWYLVDFKWCQGNWSYATAEDCPASLTLRDATGHLCILERLSPSEVRRTLGVRLALDGNSNAELA